MASTLCLVGSNTQSNRRSTVNGRITPTVFGLLVHTAQQISHRPDKRAVIVRCLLAHPTPLITGTENYTHRQPD